jgi:hypothetical protein
MEATRNVLFSFFCVLPAFLIAAGLDHLRRCRLGKHAHTLRDAEDQIQLHAIEMNVDLDAEDSDDNL